MALPAPPPLLLSMGMRRGRAATTPRAF